MKKSNLFFISFIICLLASIACLTFLLIKNDNKTIKADLVISKVDNGINANEADIALNNVLNLVELSKQAKDFMTTINAFDNSSTWKPNVKDFLRNKVADFGSMEINFKYLAKKFFNSAEKKDDNVKKLKKVCLNFSSLCQTNANIIISAMNGEGTLEIAAKKGRASAELIKNWRLLIDLLNDFLETYKSSLSNDQKKEISSVLFRENEQAINQLLAVSKKDGPEAATHILYPNGEWPLILIYFSLTSSKES